MLGKTDIMPLTFTGFVKDWLLVIAFTGSCWLLNSCSKEHEVISSEEKGKLGIRIGLEMNIQENRLQLKSTAGTEDFEVMIYHASGELLHRYEKASDLPAQIELEPGDYYVTASSKNFMAAAFDNPYYSGHSGTVTLNANEYKTIDVICSLANCAVTVKYSENIMQDFSDYFTEVGIADGKLLFAGNETRTGYFDLQPISITATLTATLENGTEYSKVLKGSIPVPGRGKLYEIGLDAGISEGYSAITILLDETMDTQIISINDNTSAGIQYGDLLITEIMYDPVVLTDTDGEWFEIFNHSSAEISLKDLVIRTASDQHVIASDILLAPGEYYLMARKEEAAAGTKYVYGTGISLTNTGGVIGIYTYGTDGTDGTEIASVAYDSGTGFPTATGASLNLDPGHFTADEAKAGSSWCTSIEIYDTGDLGTPGLENISCE
jgi:hypothetical protein